MVLLELFHKMQTLLSQTLEDSLVHILKLQLQYLQQQTQEQIHFQLQEIFQYTISAGFMAW